MSTTLASALPESSPAARRAGSLTIGSLTANSTCPGTTPKLYCVPISRGTLHVTSVLSSESPI